ncbi:MAG: flagellar hook-associated protein FlgK [Mycobacteriales bacterium]
MSFSTLNIGASGLIAAQRAVEVAANNVSNANNEAFTRQRLAIQSAPSTPGTAGLRGDGDRGTGVKVLDVTRLRDRLADVSYRSEAAVTGAADARSDALGRTNTLIGPFANGAPEDLSIFLAAWNQLSMTPTDPSAREAVLAAGQRVADGLNGAVRQLTDVGHEIGLRVADDTNELNGLLTSVAKLNYEITKATTEMRSPNELLDQRDQALDRISTLTGATLTPAANGTVDVSVGGVPLVTGVTSATVAPSGTDPVTVTVNGSTVSMGGEIGGYVATVGVDLPSYRARLDALAVGLRDVVNAAHRAGTGLDGSTGLDFYSGTDAASLSVNPSLTADQVAASASGAAADGNNALTVATALRQNAAVGSATFGDALRAFGAQVGQASADAKRNATTADATLAAAQSARAGLDGVSVDEEMVDLVKYQHSYEAAAKVIAVADSMLDKIVNDMVR